MKFRHVLLRLVCSTAFVFYAQAALAGTAGHAQFVNGDVRVINANGIAHALQKGEAINEGDTISSAKDASAQVRMEDGGFIAVRPDTQLKFDSFKIALKQGDPENSLFSLVKGSFRAVTGLIGRVNRQHYRITTPVATIGIRGTDHETAFVPNALPGVPAGAYSKVNIGETSLTTNVGSVNIKPNQMGYASGMTRIPELLPINTSLFAVAAAPAKESKVIGAKDKEEKGSGQGQQTAQNGTKEGSNGTSGGEPIRDTAVVDSTSTIDVAGTTAPATTTTVTTADTTATTVSAPAQTTIPVTLTDNSNPDLVLDTTNQTVSTGGSTVPVQSGTFGIEAQAAADAAKAAALAAATAANSAVADNTTLTGLTTVDTTPAVTAISTASPTVSTATALTPVPTTSASAAISSATPPVTSASTAVSAATALAAPATAPVSTAIGIATTGIGTASTAVTTASALTVVAAPTADTTAAQAAATATATKAAAAQAAFAANGAFADVTAAPANTATQAANTALQAANTIVQSAPATVTAQNSALTAAQAAAAAALATANANLATANSNLATAATPISALTAAQTAAAAALATANANLATANSNLATATTQNSALTAAQLAAQNALTTANTSLTAATSQNAALATAQSSAATQLAAAQAAATAAQAAATAAQTAADQAKTAQTAGDFTSAQAKLTEAQTQLTEAKNQQAVAAAALAALSSQLTTAQTAHSSGVDSVNSAVTAATTAQTQAAAAQAASTAANTAAATIATNATDASTAAATASSQAAAAQAAFTAAQAAVTSAATAATTAASSATTASTQAAAAQAALTAANAAATASSTNLATVNTNATIVTTNAPVAAYNNPAIAGDFIAVTEMSVPVSGGFNVAFAPDNPLHPNTTYVLDGSGNLVEMRNSQFQVQTSPNGIVLTPSITSTSGADIKRSGGTGADAFKLADNSIYMGRWENATVTVTDNANPANVSTYTSADNIWLLLLPPPAGYVQTLAGTTTYVMAGHTTPVDAFGNLGVLNSATLSADFTSQLVTAGVDLTMPAASSMAGNFILTGANLPIDAVGFSINNFNPSTGTLTICFDGTCSTTGGTGYNAELSGAFAGTAAASAATGYHLWPSTTGTSPMANSVQGYVALTTTTPPTALSGGPFAAYAGGNVALEYQTLFFNNSGLVLPPASAALPVSNPATSGTQAVTITQAPNSDNGFFGFTDTFTVTNPVAVTPLSSGIQYGANAFNAFSRSSTLTLGPDNDNQLRWITGPEGYLDNAGTAVIAASTPTSPVILSYHLDGSIAPTSRSNTGTIVTGTLDSATLTADLTNLTATASLGITMNSTAYSMVGSNMPIFFGNGSSTIKNQFGGNAVVTGGTCAGLTCGGFIDGAFTGQNYAGALLSYNMHDESAGLNPNGVAALAVNTPFATGGTAAPTGNSFVGITNGFGNKQAGSSSGIQQVSTSSLTTNASGVLTGFGGPSFTSTITCTSCTGTVAPSNATTGISFGTWDQGTFANSFSGTNPPTNPPLNLFWITGAEATPVYLVQVLTGTVAYNFSGGAVGDMLGNSGSITSASLAADFTHQTMAINLQGGAIGTAASGWSASTPNALIGANCGSSNACFSANSFGPPTQPGYLTVLLDGNSSTSNSSVNGQVSGQLVGNSLNGAILSFNMNGPTGTALAPTGFENLQGVAGFTSATANDPLTPYKLAVAMLNDPLVTNDGDLMIGGYQAPANVAFDGTGNLIKLNDNNKGATAIALSGGTPGSAFSGASTAAGTACNPCTDAVTGIQWGRWAPGVTATVTEAGASPKSITINGGGLHWIASPTLTGPVTLPVGGSFTYTVSGGTNPTDSNGTVGSLTSASLSANFTAQTVNVGVNVTVGSTSITSSATGVPIQQKATFEVNTTSGLAVSCAATACPTAQGEIKGGFGGAGAIGAVMAYGFLPNPAVANMITGVVALHR